MAELKHCSRCRMSTAHINDECQRCAFKKAHSKPMTAKAKAALKEANKRRKAERDAKHRDEQAKQTEG